MYSPLSVPLPTYLWRAVSDLLTSQWHVVHFFKLAFSHQVLQVSSISCLNDSEDGDSQAPEGSVLGVHVSICKRFLSSVFAAFCLVLLHIFWHTACNASWSHTDSLTDLQTLSPWCLMQTWSASLNGPTDLSRRRTQQIFGLESVPGNPPSPPDPNC